LDIVDRMLKTVSDITDPQEMVRTYWDAIHDLLPVEHYLALSRRGIEPPEFLVTRSSRFTEHWNPWSQRDKLPRLSGGLLGEIAYADRPVVIDDLPARLRADDPGRFYLEGFQSLIALPNYEKGIGVNIGISLFMPGADFDHSIVPMMHWQAGLFGRGTQNLVLRNQLQAALTRLDEEMRVVGEIQRSLLPKELPDLPGFELAAYYETSEQAGGDYYDFFPLGGDECGVFVADVSGHGTPAAVLMAVTHAIAHTRPGRPKPPHDLISYLNRHLAATYTKSGSFVTAFYATLDPIRRQFTYSSAGHNPPRLLRRGQVQSLDQTAGLPLGVSAKETYGEATIALEAEDVLLLYTDGITETMSPPDSTGSQELFGSDRLDALLIDCSRASSEDLINRICAELTNFSGGAPALDDRTLVSLRCLR
jgi:sigma-B regulation protein RsbU (phosphoserine phosphatase)